MKKLYIPTSTLNFNNILSSESISPKAFYSQRGFGFSRWTNIPENDIDNAIILYKVPFEFTRPISDVEDHPMLVEIETEEDFPSIDNDIFYSDHTIYLSPWRTRFIFFSSQDRQIALSVSDSSLEVKLLGLYGKRIDVENYVRTNPFIPKKEVELNVNEIQHDFRINKMKGLLYGYYIGTLLSESPEVTRKHNLLQNLKDNFSAVLSAGKKELTIHQNENIRFLLVELQKTNPAILYLQKKLANSQEIEEVVNQCVRLGVKFPNIIDKDAIMNSLLQFSDNKSNTAVDWLNREWELLKQQTIRERKLLSPVDEEIIVTDCLLSRISNERLSDIHDEQVVKAWINDILISNDYNGRVSIFKSKLSDEVTQKTKDVYKEQWDGSEIKQKLNSMRRYIKGSESGFQWNNYLVSSIAAVMAKGDDWEKLLAFMQSKGMSDYRLAFAFYGELNGFANLNRDFTDNLFGLQNKEYVAEVYKEVYGQLLGDDFYPEDKMDMFVENLEESKPTNKETLSSKEYLLLVWNAIKEKIAIKKRQKLEDSFMLAIEHYDENLDLNVFLNYLKSFPGWKGSEPWNELRKELGITVNVLKNRKPRNMKKVQPYLPFKEQNEDLPFSLHSLEDVKDWKARQRILDNWNYAAKQKGYMSSEHISFFVNLCLKEGRGERKQYGQLEGHFSTELGSRVLKELNELKKVNNGNR